MNRTEAIKRLEKLGSLSEGVQRSYGTQHTFTPTNSSTLTVYLIRNGFDDFTIVKDLTIGDLG